VLTDPFVSLCVSVGLGTFISWPLLPGNEHQAPTTHTAQILPYGFLCQGEKKQKAKTSASSVEPLAKHTSANTRATQPHTTSAHSHPPPGLRVLCPQPSSLLPGSGSRPIPTATPSATLCLHQPPHHRQVCHNCGHCFDVYWDFTFILCNQKFSSLTVSGQSFKVLKVKRWLSFK